MDPRLTEEKAEMVALRALPGIDNRQIGQLLALYGSPAGAWEAVLLGAANGPSKAQTMARWQKLAEGFDPAHELRNLQSKKIEVVIKGERGYPHLLSATHDAPWVLFYKGRMAGEDRAGIAVIGSRKATPYGLEVARMLGRELAGAGVNVISGAAYGIDSAAHQGALDCGGFTTAVVGCGVDLDYPRSNSGLFRRIAQSGCILSEYRPGTRAAKHHFPARNRIIAGMSRAVVVVEAARESGALITVDFALAEGREVMAVPGDLFSHNSRGTNALIKNGAVVVTRPEDITRELGLESSSPRAPVSQEGMSQIARTPEEQVLMTAIANGVTEVGDLSRETGMNAGDTLARLSRLEIAGAVVRGPGGRYCLSAEVQADVIELQGNR
jgi:DNA processing protein